MKEKWKIGLFLLAISGCIGPEIEPLPFFEVTTGAPQAFDELGKVQITSFISSLEDATLDDYGIYWSTSLEELETDINAAQQQSFGPGSADQGGVKEFTWSSTSLSLDSAYYFKAYAILKDRKVYGQSRVFFWGTTASILNIEVNNDSASVEVRVANLQNRGVTVTDYGVVYSSSSGQPFLGVDVFVPIGSISDDRTITIPVRPLEFNTDYYFRPYLKTNAMTYYGDVVTKRVEDGWKLISNPGQSMTRATATTLNGAAYLGFFCTGPPCFSAESSSQFLKFTPSSNNGLGAWEPLPALPVHARINSVAFGINGKVYSGLGEYFDPGVNENFVLSDFNAYDPLGQQWQVNYDYSPPGYGRPRSGAVAFVMGDKAYIGTGSLRNSINQLEFNTFIEFDPAKPSGQRWRQVAALPGFVRTDAVTFVIGDKAYVIGGVSGGTQLLNDCWEFTPPANDGEQGEWHSFPDFPDKARFDAIGFAANGKGYYGLGENFLDGLLNDFWEFDPSKSQPWSKVTSFQGRPRARAVGFSIDNKGYVGGGETREINGGFLLPVVLSDFWMYVPPSQ